MDHAPDNDKAPDRAAGGFSRLAKLKILADYAKRYKKLAAAALVALVVAALANLGAVAALEPVIDRGFNAEDPGAIDKFFLWLFALVCILAVASALRGYFVALLGERVAADLRQAAHARVVGLHPSFFEENRPSEIASRLTADASLIQQVLSVSASIALRNIALFFGGLTMMVIYNPVLMAMMLVAIPAVVVPIIVLGRRVRKLSRSSQDRIADVGTLATETLGAIQVVQAYTREGEERRRFGRAVEDAYHTARRRLSARALLTAVVIFLISGAITFVLWQGAKQVVMGNMTGGEMAAFVGFAAISAAAAGAVVEVYGEVQRAAGAAGRLGELLRTRSDIQPPPDPTSLPEPPEGAVAFEGVRFSYPAKPDVAALDGFDLAIEPGESVALVGPSGAGKSTVLQLLLRFFDPQEGRIRVDGVDLRDADPQALRDRMAVVPQDTVIFADSVAENIRYGRPGAGDAEVEAAAKAAVAHDFILELAGGYDTYLGERGVRLSGGQRQRIAIARAILRDAPILLLDEATSALDAEAERKVQTALEHLMTGRTTIMIAHRLATVLKADRIVVMDAGRTIATGSHDELMQADPLYQRLATLQFNLDEVGRPAQAAS